MVFDKHKYILRWTKTQPRHRLRKIELKGGVGIMIRLFSYDNVYRREPVQKYLFLISITLNHNDGVEPGAVTLCDVFCLS